MLAEKMRVHILAKELNVSSKVILEKCKAEGLDNVVKNHMSTLGPGLYATIREWFSEAALGTAVETSAKVDLEKVRVKPRRTRKKAAPTEQAVEEAVPTPVEELTEATPVEVEAEPATAPLGEPVLETADPDAIEPATAVPAAAEVAAEADAAGAEIAAEADGAVAVAVPEVALLAEPMVVTTETQAPESDAQPLIAPPAAAEQDQEAPPLIPSEEGAAAAAAEAPPAEKTPPEEEVAPAGPQNVPVPAQLKGPRVVRYEAPDQDTYYRRPPVRGPRPAPGTVGPAEPSPQVGIGPGKAGGKADQSRRGRVNPRRAVARVREADDRLKEYRDRDLAERQQRLAGVTGRRIHRRRTVHAPHGAPVTAPGPRTQAKVHEPIAMKEFCSETGLNFIQCFKVLKNDHNILANINMTLPTEVAELLALGFGIDLEVVQARTQLDMLKDEVQTRKRSHLEPRSPVVTMLGHVDHGKTSLLDAIRKTQVVADEDGGITQHIGASYLDGPHGKVTFLDTPGHEAFTAMRARGAHLTDVVVLVIAADDGVMPQTTEAINHAKSADVSIVVALNKIDLGEQNVLKIYGQLAEQGLTPSGEWGGETDVIHMSATTGAGVNELVEHLANLSELLDLKADPTLPAVGAVIEAEKKTGVGPVVRVLIQDGTLHVGDVVVCGNAFGKVRAILDDRGRRLKGAGPARPVEVWGLDDVPLSGDNIYCVDNLQRAKTIASETKQARIAGDRQRSRKVLSLEDMFRQRDREEIPELNLVLKGDVDGSVQTLKQTLSEIPSDEVKLTIRHAGVGAVNDSDVLLAAACEGIVVAFRVETSVEVRRLAERHGVEIRPYRVIYDTSDDIKKALEGLLAPEERLETRATVQVRDVFRISKVGLVAGCYVTDGVVNRNHLVRVIRDGTLVREGCKLESLRRFKEDAKEVRNGLECGIRLQDFDDIHEGDTLECYEVVKIARTL